MSAVSSAYCRQFISMNEEMPVAVLWPPSTPAEKTMPAAGWYPARTNTGVEHSKLLYCLFAVLFLPAIKQNICIFLYKRKPCVW